MLEKGLSSNSIEAYINDISKLILFLNDYKNKRSLLDLKLNDLGEFFKWLSEIGFTARSQARINSGIKSFYTYLFIEKLIKENPTELLESPKIPQKLPEVLSIEEIERIIATIDMSHPQAYRDRTMLEVLYSCGLRVSELVDLKISMLYLDKGFARVIGKGNKERLVPIGKQAIKQLRIFIDEVRPNVNIQNSFEDHLFLNNRGSGISRISVFKIIKKLVALSGIKKKVSPHTFRHSFATHLVEGGADLRAVQEMLGHRSITTTEIYTHLDRNYLRSVILDYHPLEKAERGTKVLQ